MVKAKWGCDSGPMGDDAGPGDIERERRRDVKNEKGHI